MAGFWEPAFFMAGFWESALGIAGRGRRPYALYAWRLEWPDNFSKSQGESVRLPVAIYSDTRYKCSP